MAPEPQPEDPRDEQHPHDQQDSRASPDPRTHSREHPRQHQQHPPHQQRPQHADEGRLSSALFPGDIPQDDLDAYVGMPRRDAERQASARGWRPVRSLPPDAVVTMEYVAGRLNFTVAEDRVTRCWTG